MPVFAFLCGIVVTAALLVPIQSPDHQRGYIAGYTAAMEDSKKYMAFEYQYGFEAGVQSVKHWSH
jgi:hypothetical protein